MAQKILVTGGTGFLGYRTVYALLEQGAQVTVIGPSEAQERLGALLGRVTWATGDVWNPGSLRGRARGHQAVIHLVGAIKADPKRGLTFRQLNTVSARNTAQMAVSDGVPHFVLLSASGGLPGISSEYLASKREAEVYLRKTGLTWTIVRAPPLYDPHKRRALVYVLLTQISHIPLLGNLVAPIAPLSVDVAARGISRLALHPDLRDRLIGASRLRAIGRSPLPPTDFPAAQGNLVDGDSWDEGPFGWLPPT